MPQNLTFCASFPLWWGEWTPRQVAVVVPFYQWANTLGNINPSKVISSTGGTKGIKPKVPNSKAHGPSTVPNRERGSQQQSTWSPGKLILIPSFILGPRRLPREGWVLHSGVNQSEWSSSILTGSLQKRFLGLLSWNPQVRITESQNPITCSLISCLSEDRGPAKSIAQVCKDNRLGFWCENPDQNPDFQTYNLLPCSPYLFLQPCWYPPL